MLSKILAIPPILSFMSGTHWPTAVDYQTALQIPHLSFSRDDLRNATIETTTWGLPLALTGNMAVVFRLIREDKRSRCAASPGSRRWAAWKNATVPCGAI